MRINALKAKDITPISTFDVSELGDVIIIAGANGSGKTRLKEAIIQTFQNPQAPQIEIDIESTRPEQEKNTWGTAFIKLVPDTPNNVFQVYMDSRTRGGTYTGSVIQIDSNRSVQPVKFQVISLATPDPDDQEIDRRYYLSPFIGRWQELVNKIFQKMASRDHKIAQYVKQHPDGTNADVLSLNPDPFIPYQKVFAKLLPGKTLEPIDPTELKEFLYRIDDSNPLPFSTLSSGEQEVVRIAFDLIWKKIKHCVILIDEPELHLHSTLAFRLVETLKSLGDNTNQFFLFTHSADLISTYYASGNVYFIDLEDQNGNQAKRLSSLDENHIQTARALGNNLGVFAVGKKLVFVEGDEASVDRLTYHRIAQLCFSEAHIFPTGSVENILALNRLSRELQRSIFGIDFFMIRDRDGLSNEQIHTLESNPRFKCLRRRQIENYYLDAEVLTKVAENFYLDDEWRDPEKVDAKLQEIAQSLVTQSVVLTLKQFVTVCGTLDAPRVPDMEKKSVSDVKNEFISTVNDSLSDVTSIFSPAELAQKFDEQQQCFQTSLQKNTWKVVFPGKLIFGHYCGVLGQDVSRVRQAYLDIALEQKPVVFSEIRRIFEGFAAIT